MTNSTTFSLFFRIRKKASQPDQSTIQARLKVDNDRVDFSLNRSVTTSLWDATNRKARGSSLEAKKLNLFLEEIKMNIFGAYDQLRREHKLITAEAVKARYFNEDISELTLVSAFDYHNEEVSHTLAPGTAMHYRTSLAHVRRFMNRVLKTEDIFLSGLSYKLYSLPYTKFKFKNILTNRNIISEEIPPQSKSNLKNRKIFKPILSKAFGEILRLVYLFRTNEEAEDIC